MAGRNPRHAAQMRAASRARNAAIRELIRRHRDEYRDLYAVEAAAWGVSMAPHAGRGLDPDRHDEYFDSVRSSPELADVTIPPRPDPRVIPDREPVVPKAIPEHALTREQIVNAIHERFEVPPLPGSESETHRGAMPSIPEAPF